MRSRPQSRKLRALIQALSKPAEQIVAEYALQPLTYAEIAAEWQRAVSTKFPNLTIEYGANDVYLLFHKHGIRRSAGVTTPAVAA